MVQIVFEALHGDGDENTGTLPLRLLDLAAAAFTVCDGHASKLSPEAQVSTFF